MSISHIWLFKICLKSPCTASTALLALIEVQGLLRQILLRFLTRQQEVRAHAICDTIKYNRHLIRVSIIRALMKVTLFMPRYCVKRGQVFPPLAINACLNKYAHVKGYAVSAVLLFCYPHSNTVPLSSLQFKD